MKAIDINCDLGEGFGNEAEIMPYIHSCNIACGGHAGDKITVRKTVALAKNKRVKIGAHPSYPDKKNFGRLSIEISKKALQESLAEQLQLFRNAITELDTEWHHIKPHGALYNDVACNKQLASWCLEVFQEYGVKIYVPYNSEIAKKAEEMGIPIVYEGFADRNYNDDLSLVSRKQPNAVLKDVSEIISHVKRMYYRNKVKTVNNNEKYMLAETFCVHSDTANATTIVKRIYQQLNMR